jgi:hypothetical protein
MPRRQVALDNEPIVARGGTVDELGRAPRAQAERAADRARRWGLALEARFDVAAGLVAGARLRAGSPRSVSSMDLPNSRWFFTTLSVKSNAPSTTLRIPSPSSGTSSRSVSVNLLVASVVSSRFGFAAQSL